MRRAALIGATLACAAGIGGALALSASGEEPRPVPPRSAAAVVERPQTELPPLPSDHEAKVVEPVAGASEGAAPAEQAVEQAPPTTAPKPNGAASPSKHVARPTTAGDGINEATALPNGIALPPLEAPGAVRQMIEAGNVIARSTYKWGGGHGKWT